MLSKIVKYIKDPTNFVFFLQNRCNFPVLPDELYLKLSYKQAFGKKLNLENPRTYTEKLQWLKLHDRKPEYINMVDKYAVKKYVSDIIGPEYIIPTLGVWERFDDIDFDALPDQFVLKCTHDSGGVVIVKDKSQMDIPAARKVLKKSLKKNYYYSGREWVYKNIPPRIIAEKYLNTPRGLEDYKFFCFSGKVKCMGQITGRGTPGIANDFFDEHGNWINLHIDYPNAKIRPMAPEKFEEMKRIAEILSAGIPHVRVDLYEVEGKIYFGELTFFIGSGMLQMEPDEWDLKLGEILKLPSL